MQGIIDFILGDAGILVAIVIGVLLLTFTAYGLLLSKGFVKERTKTGSGRFTRVTSVVLGPQHSYLYVLGAFVILVVGFASLGLWNQITTTAPYVSNESYNFVFISMVVVLLVSMASLAIVLMRLLGQFEMYRRLNP